MAAATDRAPRRGAARERDGARGSPLIAYFDSSAFVKLVLNESGTEEVREMYLSATRVRSSRALVPEVCAAVGRARRNGRLGRAATTRAAEAARELLAEVEPIELDVALADHAGELALTHDLRGYDAVHLASYELIETDKSVLVAADGDLVRAAKAIGYAVAVPGA